MKEHCVCPGLKLVLPGGLCSYCKYPLTPNVSVGETVTESTGRQITGPEVRAAYEKSGRNLAMTGKLLFPQLPSNMSEPLASRLVQQYTQG